MGARGGGTQLLLAPTSPTLVPFWGMNGLPENQNSTPILESNRGLGALNQGSILPSRSPDPTHSLSAPLESCPCW